MKPPQIQWDYQNLPSNADSMEPLGTFTIDSKTVFIAINHTRGELMFIWDDAYGKLISGGEG